MKEKTVLVIGSNAFSGSDFIDHLLRERPYQVIGVSRSPEKSDLFLPYKKNKALFNELCRRGYPVRMPCKFEDLRRKAGYWTIHLIFRDKRGKAIHKVTEKQRLDWFDKRHDWKFRGGPAVGLKKNFEAHNKYVDS